MGAKHTPGPWSIFDQHDATRINVRGPSEEFIADCADGFYSDETDDWVMAEESLPNARLIAAAPETKDIAQRFVKWAERVEADDEDCEYLNGNGWDDLRALAAEAKAVLARATGAA